MDDSSNVLLKAAQPPAATRFSRLALVSFVSANLSLAGLVTGLWVPGAPYAFLCFIPAVICGHLARREFRSAPGAFRNAPMATFGLAAGYLGLFLSIFVISAMFFGAITFAR